MLALSPARMVNSVHKRNLHVTNPLGLHLRPWAKFVAISEKYPNCDLKVTHDGVEADGKSIMSLLMLAAGHGSVIELAASGEGAVQMLDELEKLARSNFGE